MEVEKTLMQLVESQVNLITKMAEVIESNDRLTKALIESYSEAEPDYNVDIPLAVYMDGSPVKGYHPNESLKTNPPGDE